MPKRQKERFYILIPEQHDDKLWKHKKDITAFFGKAALPISGGKFGPYPDMIRTLFVPLLRDAGSSENLVCIGPIAKGICEDCLWRYDDANISRLWPFTVDSEARMDELWSMIEHQKALLQPAVHEVQQLCWRANQDRQKLTAMSASWISAKDSFDRVIGEINRLESKRRAEIEAAVRPILDSWRANVQELARLVEAVTRKDKSLRDCVTADFSKALVRLVKGQPICLTFPQWAV